MLILPGDAVAIFICGTYAACYSLSSYLGDHLKDDHLTRGILHVILVEYAITMSVYLTWPLCYKARKRVPRRAQYITTAACIGLSAVNCLVVAVVYSVYMLTTQVTNADIDKKIILHMCLLSFSAISIIMNVRNVGYTCGAILRMTGDY